MEFALVGVVTGGQKVSTLIYIICIDSQLMLLQNLSIIRCDEGDIFRLSLSFLLGE